jgi:hypothetical protein
VEEFKEVFGRYAAFSKFDWRELVREFDTNGDGEVG